MTIVTYLRAFVFRDLKSAQKLADVNPSIKNIKLLAELTGVKNSVFSMPKKPSSVVLDSQSKSLIGRSIKPDIASKNLTKVKFNSFGEIIDISAPLKKSVFILLSNNIVKPLKETPVSHQDGKIRTLAECAIDMACVIKNSDIQSDEKLILLDEIKAAYLSGSLSSHKLGLFIERSSRIFGGGSPVINKLQELLKSVEKKFYFTKHNDNYYGRTFDSTIAELVVSKPSSEMKENIKTIKEVLVNDFNSLDKYQQKNLIKLMREDMFVDPAIWHPGITEIKKFLNECTPDNYIKMLNTESDIGHLLIMYLAVKQVKNSKGFGDMRSIATTLYEAVIVPQRTLDKVENNQEESNRTGIRLNYQIQDENKRKGFKGERPIDRYKLSVKNLTEHNLQAHNLERPICIGMSGASCILRHLFISLAEEYTDFNRDHAELFSASFLTYSGGHSISEAYTVFGYDDKGDFKTVSYSKLSEKNEYAKRIIDIAYDKLLDEANRLN